MAISAEYYLLENEAIQKFIAIRGQAQELIQGRSEVSIHPFFYVRARDLLHGKLDDLPGYRRGPHVSQRREDII